jgi:hypothetical protein
MDKVRDIEELRALYIKGTPQQRYKMALDRIDNPDCLPNRLVGVVCAIEVLVKALLINLRADPILLEDYKKEIQFKKLVDLLKELDREDRSFPDNFFKSVQWQIFRKAIEYRNFFMHEAGFLREGDCKKLIAASEEILGVLRSKIKVV